MSDLHPILINGEWRAAHASGSFHADNPATGQPLAAEYPISTWEDCEAALAAASAAASLLRDFPRATFANFLNAFAARIEARADEIADLASMETGLPKAPRLRDVELPRTTMQLRRAAAAAAEGSWALPTIDTKINIRSCHEAIGPVLVMGPNNFPLAYNAVCGGDFASAIAAGNPVIAKGHPAHPGVTCLIAAEAAIAIREAGLPPGTLQLLCHINNEDGLRLISDPRMAAIGFTGSRGAGLRIKAAADAAGKPAYMEMSSLNPVVILPGALTERADAIAGEYTASALMACGQMCTKPGVVLLPAGAAAEQFIAKAKEAFEAAPVGPLLTNGVAKNLRENITLLESAGAKQVTTAPTKPLEGFRAPNTLLRVTGTEFLAHADKLMTEAFGNTSLCVVAENTDQIINILKRFEGNLTGSIYSDSNGADDAVYPYAAAILRAKVGRLLNDKMPTGVAVTAAMNHGGPYPATSHAGFTAVGFPASIRRFSMLACYDHVRAARLPELLRDACPEGRPLRLIDSEWTQGNAPSPAQ